MITNKAIAAELAPLIMERHPDLNISVGQLEETIGQLLDKPAGDDLLPVERVAFKVALARVMRGAEPLPNMTKVCVLALGRLLGELDYITEPEPDGECFRGREAASKLSELQDHIQRELKR